MIEIICLEFNGVLISATCSDVTYAYIFSDHDAPANKFFVPHSLSLSDHMGLLAVADRENYRVQFFDLEGQHKITTDSDMAVYAVAFRGDTGT